ncbi:SDR family oxidoreductase [Flagellimonas flava]|uniref:SDR family oxidoreductase n=1 Tax=Flagellimonas flava TaxID=570519 RepID=UPI003D6471B6
MTKQLNNKIALITGGSSGIGLATAQKFVEQGAHVIIVGRNEEALNTAVSQLGEQSYGIRADISNLSDLDNLYNEVKTKYQKLDILFVNAGVAGFSPIDGTDEAKYDHLFDINVKGAYFTIQKALPLIPEGGSIVLTTSVINGKGLPGTSAYSATKAAVRSFARTLATELAPRGIRINAVSPGHTATPIVTKIEMDEDAMKAMENEVKLKTPLGRMGQPEEIASVATFLASPESSFVTGAEFPADGGYAQI